MKNIAIRTLRNSFELDAAYVQLVKSPIGSPEREELVASIREYETANPLKKESDE